MGFKSGGRVLVILLFAGLLMPARAIADAEHPVERVNAALLHVMRNANELGYKGRYDALLPVLNEAFNFPAMARVSLRKHWKSLSPEKRARFTRAFTDFSVANFANRFDAYDGERFQINGTQEHRKLLVVDNRLVRPSGEVIPINYVVREFDGRWRIIDVRLDAKFSQLAMQRTEFSAIMASGGFETLIATLERKVADFARRGQTAWR